MVITSIIGALAVIFGVLLILDRRHFSDGFKRAIPSALREAVSDDQARLAPVFGGLMFILMGILLALLGFVLVPSATAA